MLLFEDYKSLLWHNRCPMNMVCSIHVGVRCILVLLYNHCQKRMISPRKPHVLHYKHDLSHTHHRFCILGWDVVHRALWMYCTYLSHDNLGVSYMRQVWVCTMMLGMILCFHTRCLVGMFCDKVSEPCRIYFHLCSLRLSGNLFCLLCISCLFGHRLALVGSRCPDYTL